MGASMKQIKTRIKSVESTRQITKAMELVATSKLRKAKLRAENARPYHKVLLEAISAIQAGAAEPFTYNLLSPIFSLIVVFSLKAVTV